MTKEGYKVLTKEKDYKTQNTTKIDFICPNGHKHNISVRKWRNYGRCGKCRVSKEEQEIRNLLNTHNIKYKMNDRNTILNPFTNHYLELDFLFPKLNKAIEYNGSYWHSLDEKIAIDKLKSRLCEEKNIDLMVITDIDWYENRVKCIDDILIFVKEK